MEEEHSPMIDIVGDVTKAPLPEASNASSGEHLAIRPKLTLKMPLIHVSLREAMTLEHLRL
jgi:hypothetical protein